MAGQLFSRTPRAVPKVETRYRSIKTSLPCEGTSVTLEQMDRFESRSMHGQIPLVWDKAKDFSLWDKAGNKWIDFTSTIFVTNIGHSNPNLIKALKEGLDHDLLHSYAYATEIRATYLKRLVEFAGPRFEKAFLLSAGTEATEAAVKLMRMNGQKKGKRRPGIVCIEGNWHGRTMGAQMMSSKLDQKEWIGYQDPNIHHIPFPYPWRLEKGVSGEAYLEQGLKQLRDSGLDLEKDLCGFMLETFQGWGAVFYPKDFVQAISRLCKKNGLLLAFDEMQAGFARTGKRFGFEHYEVEADLLAVGKGMGSGLPLSGVIGRREVMDLPEIGNMSSTHSANPMVCTAGLVTIAEIERLNLVSETARKGELMFRRLGAIKQKHADRVWHILGNGLIGAILFKNPKTNEPDGAFTSRVAERAWQKGVLFVHTGRESIKLGAPLTITDDAINEAMDVLEESVAEITREG